MTLAALALALLTEGLQIFASNREPSWQDVAIDMTGAAAGALLVWVARLYMRKRADLRAD
jgi:VanZ family protein